MKKYLPKIAFCIGPVVILLMYLIKGFALCFETTTYGNIVVDPTRTNVSFYHLLSKENTLVLPKVLAIISLVILLSSIVMLVLSFLKKDKEVLFNKMYVLLLLGSLLILPFTLLTKLSSTTNGAAVTTIWYDFMTIPFALLVVYVVVLIYLTFKPKKD